MVPINRFAGLLTFFIRRKVFRHSLPLLASFKLTYRCNLACLACPYHERAGEDGDHMSWQTAVHALDALKGEGALMVVFEGGEPFLWYDGRHDLNDLVRYAQKRFPWVAVTTNGTFPLESSADILWVSLDGTKDLHDRLRSRSFDRVWSNLRLARHERLFVHFTINRENRHDMRPLLEMLRDIKAFRGMTLQLFYPYGQGEAPLALSGEERLAALSDVIHLKKQGFPIMNSISRLKALIKNDWHCHDDILINVDPDGAVTRGCYVKNRGRIHCAACGFSPVAEASGALDLIPGSLLAGWSIFLR